MRSQGLPFLLGALLASVPAQASEPDAVPYGSATAASINSTIPYIDLPMRETLNQGDPRWARDVFCGSRTLKASGCVIASVVMMMNALGDTTYDLREVTRRLKEFKAFNEACHLDWDIFKKAYPEFAVDRQNTAGEIAYVIALGVIRQGGSVSFQLMRPDQHWVASTTISGNELIIRDPDGGKESLFLDRYSKDQIVGISVLWKA